jgi:C-terminal processing protease CtpA/Prc
VTERYFDTRVAAAIIAQLQHDAPALKQKTNRAAFAAAVTASMASIAHDAHLKLLDKPDVIPESASSPQAAAEMERARNYGIASVSILPGNIGCISMSGFARFTPETAQRLAWAFEMVANTYGLVIDVTNSRGGDPATEAAVMRYFIGPNITLDSMVDREGNRMDVITPEKVSGTEYGAARPVAVAVSAKTISAAESLPYDLQAMKRARIFGERTRGGANPGNFQPISDGFIAFVPVARAVNAITHTNWEGTGVRPHEVVPADRAVDTARVWLIRQVLKQENDETRRTILARGLPVESKSAG